MASFKLNFRPSPADARDFIITMAPPLKQAGAPKAAQVVDLAPDCTSIKNQGNIGACTAFSGVGSMEFLQKKYNAAKEDDIFSERFLYYATRVNTELQPATEDSGAYLRDVIKTVAKYGICKELTFPYTDDYSTPPPKNAYDEAVKFQALCYGRFDGTTDSKATILQAMKSNLEKGFPILIGFTCYETLYNTGSDGMVPLPGGQVIGGHAVLLVGYDEAKQAFKFKNSWGADWGVNGYGYLPYQYYLSGNMSDCWSIYQAEDNDLKHIGVDIYAPPNPPTPTDQKLVDVKSILTTILDRVSNLTTVVGLAGTCNDLVDKYQKEGNVKMYSLVANIKSQFKYIVKP